MNPIERIKAKALQAKDIAPQAIRAFESDLDGILAEKSVLEQKRQAAVAPHKQAISGIYSEFDGLKQAMDILSNGGPPLTESGPDAPGLQPETFSDTGTVEHLQLTSTETKPATP